VWKDSEWAVQQGSYINPVVPPTTDPCDAPTVSVCINQDWIPYVCGALSQLCQPTTWITSSDADLIDVLERVTHLISAIGTAMPCTSPAPVFGTAGTAQRACNISGYLSNVLIKDSIQQAIDAINENKTLLGYGRAIVFAIPGAGVVINIIAQGLYALYGAIESGTLTDYADAVADPTLWSKITCAIYNATAADGQVTDTNFPAIVTNVAAVSYVHAGVITTIVEYVNNLGATGLENLQGTGAFAAYNCANCGTGLSSGPGGLPIRELSSSSALTILAGTATITGSVVFAPPFTAAPILTLQSQNPVLIASAASITATGFDLTITAAVNVDVDTAAVVDWIAVLPGTSV
jgi:hypothetical protein